MKKFVIYLFGLFISLTFVGCASVNSLYRSDGLIMSIPKDTENTPQYIEWREGVVLRQITNMNGDIWPIDRISVFDYYIWLYIGE